MGSSKTVNQTQPVGSMLQDYTKYLPDLIKATSAEQSTIAQGNLDATKATQDAYNALNLQQLQQYGVPLAEAGQQVQLSNALAGGATNLAQIQGSGGQAAQAAADLARQTNPNYYMVQDAASQQAKNLLGSINLGGLSGGEQAAIERSLAQTNSKTGNLGLNNATNTISNAMNFGGAFNQKLGVLGQALGAANGVATSAQNTGFSPVNIALGQPNVSTMGNMGTGTFNNTNAGTQAGSLGANTSMGQGMLNTVTQTGLANNTQTNKANPWEVGAQYASAVGSVCCFIFLEYNYGELPWYVRRCRDRYYVKFPQIAKGYIKMAKWLVPMMRKFNVVKWLVWKTMVSPLTEHGKHIVRLDNRGRRYRIVRKFWFAVWNKLGAK